MSPWKFRDQKVKNQFYPLIFKIHSVLCLSVDVRTVTGFLKCKITECRISVESKYFSDSTSEEVLVKQFLNIVYINRWQLFSMEICVCGVTVILLKCPREGSVITMLSLQPYPQFIQLGLRLSSQSHKQHTVQKRLGFTKICT